MRVGCLPPARPTGGLMPVRHRLGTTAVQAPWRQAPRAPERLPPVRLPRGFDSLADALEKTGHMPLWCNGSRAGLKPQCLRASGFESREGYWPGGASQRFDSVRVQGSKPCRWLRAWSRPAPMGAWRNGSAVDLGSTGWGSTPCAPASRSRWSDSHRHWSVAQLVAQSALDRKDAGSNPATPTMAP